MLLTEALRGAGAHVVAAEETRFLFEYHAGGNLHRGIWSPHAVSSRQAWLDCRHLGRDVLDKEFRSVTAACRRAGSIRADDLLSIAPAAHYFIGGIQTDLDGRSSDPSAVRGRRMRDDEGPRREALVFGRRAARAIAGQRMGRAKDLPLALTLSARPAIDVENEGDNCGRR